MVASARHLRVPLGLHVARYSSSESLRTAHVLLMSEPSIRASCRIWSGWGKEGAHARLVAVLVGDDRVRRAWLSSTIVPPAATAAAIRSSATSGATRRLGGTAVVASRARPCPGTRGWAPGLWHHERRRRLCRGRWPRCRPSAVPPTLARSGPHRCVERSSIVVIDAGSARTDCSAAISLTLRARSTSRSVTHSTVCSVPSSSEHRVLADELEVTYRRRASPGDGDPLRRPPRRWR